MKSVKISSFLISQKLSACLEENFSICHGGNEKPSTAAMTEAQAGKKQKHYMQISPKHLQMDKQYSKMQNKRLQLLGEKIFL